MGRNGGVGKERRNEGRNEGPKRDGKKETKERMIEEGGE
jgi:hypothetical protein